MLTVTQLARRCGLSRTAVLYYESIGLLAKPRRTEGNYRAYAERDLGRLREICVYRNAGLKLADIRAVLGAPGSDAAAVLARRIGEIDREIGRLREHQLALVSLLKQRTDFRRNLVLTKDKLVSIMRNAGLEQEDMNRFHQEFEKTAPEDHQAFLEYLHIPAEEIRQIREKSR